MVKKAKRYSTSKTPSLKIKDIDLDEVWLPRFEVPRSEAYEEIQRCLRDLQLMRF